MAKRFCDPQRWDDSWYRKLTPQNKNFWDFLYCQCDNAGVWKPDLELAAVFVGCPIELNVLDILNNGKERVKILSNGYWWVCDYVSFQFGEEIKNPKVRKHVFDLIRKYSDFGYPTNTQYIPNVLSMDTPKDKDKDKDKVKEQEKDSIKPSAVAFSFEDIWSIYPKRVGKKEALRHFKATVKTEKDHDDIHQALINYKDSERVMNGYIFNGSTWFNNWRDWIDYKETACAKCKGKGKYTSSTGYLIVCDCPKGKNP